MLAGLSLIFSLAKLVVPTLFASLYTFAAGNFRNSNLGSVDDTELRIAVKFPFKFYANFLIRINSFICYFLKERWSI